MKNKLTFLTITLTMAANLAIAAPGPNNKPAATVEAKVRHDFNRFLNYGIFDNLEFRVEGGSVTLLGQTNRPVLRSDAANIVRHIEGVTSVTNEIEVLPVSFFDDGIRLRVARSVYGQSALNRYALGTHPSIHVIVKNGNVSLEGVVAREMDRIIAGLQANSVPGVFSVQNNLRIEK